MINRVGRVTIFAYCAPTDMRKGFEGLSGLVREELGKDPLCGALFLFTNRRRTHAKVLTFDGTGLCVYAKRLERGRFAALWKYTDHEVLRLKRSELQLFLEGSHIVARFKVSQDDLSNSDLASQIQT